MAGLSALSSGNTQVDLLSLINVMADPEKFRGQIEEMRVLQAQLDEKIALAGKADEIIAIRAAVEGELSQAGANRISAEHAAKELVAKANKKAATLEAAANERLVQAEQNAAALLAKVQHDAKILLDSHKVAIAKANAAIQARNKELDAITTVQQARLAEINEKQIALNTQLDTFEKMRTEHAQAVLAHAKKEESHQAKVKKLQDSWNSFVKQAL
jgi:hypothetical protein